MCVSCKEKTCLSFEKYRRVYTDFFTTLSTILNSPFKRKYFNVLNERIVLRSIDRLEEILLRLLFQLYTHVNDRQIEYVNNVSSCLNNRCILSFYFNILIPIIDLEI